MRILLISFYFPPANTMGAIAVGELAKYLQRAGDQVEVLTARSTHPVNNLAIEGLDDLVVHRLPWFDVNRPVDRLRRDKAGRTVPGHAVADGWKASAARSYRHLAHLPDSKAGWIPRAIRRGLPVVDRFDPDAIFASGPPASGLVIGSSLAKRARRRRNIVFCAHFRDPWADNPLAPVVGLRRRLDLRWEAQTVGDADLILANDAGHAASLSRRLAQPIHHWPNGFDEDDYTIRPSPTTDARSLELVHTGSVYPTAQDLDSLFRGVAACGVAARRLTLRFIGAGLDSVTACAQRHGVEDLVKVEGTVSKTEAARRQMSASIQILLAPEEPDWLLGKTFAYAGARRPIWAIGSPANATSRLVERYGLGEVLPDAPAVAEAVHRLLRDGPGPDLPAAVAAPLSRRQRVHELRALIRAAGGHSDLDGSGSSTAARSPVLR